MLRGFALCGILFVNIMWFKAPGSLGGFGYEGPPLDRLVAAGVFALAQAKFFTLFSFLFGWGFATQFLRAEERGGSAGFPRRFLRRSAILGLIGVVHIVCCSRKGTSSSSTPSWGCCCSHCAAPGRRPCAGG